MFYESGYDSVRLPFKPDLARGYWAKPSDFIFTGISLAFRLDIFSSAFMLFTYNGYASTFPYLIALFVFVVPLFVMQSFLGQFSSSGFISAFRIVPLFKGIGYISLAVNFGVLTYYSIFAAIPLFYLFNSMGPTLPWSCEGIKSWSYKLADIEKKHICYMLYKYNDTIIYSSADPIPIYGAIPSHLFLRILFEKPNIVNGAVKDLYLSWELLLCTLAVWTLIAALFYKMNKIEKLSSILRCSIFVVLVLLLIIVMRFFLILKDPWTALYNFLIPEWRHALEPIPGVGVHVLAAFGAGWGTVIALASYNKFHTPIMQHSWTICCGQMLVFFSFSYITYVSERYFKEIRYSYRDNNHIDYTTKEPEWVLFLATGSVMAEMEWPNLWCILYFTLLLLAALITMIVCLFSTLQSLFDEFERLRSQKTEVTFIVIGVLAIWSLYTCSNQGPLFKGILSHDTLVTQTALNLLLLLVVLWVYGRMRFQQDIQFMLNQRFATWKVYMLRILAPLCLILMLIISLILSIVQHRFANYFIQIASLCFIAIPWLFIPGYMIYIMQNTTGTFKARFKRCVRPLDWYPLEFEDQQRYQEVVRRADVAPQLNHMDGDVMNMRHFMT